MDDNAEEVAVRDEIDEETAGMLRLLEQDPGFANLSDSRQEALKSAWENFVTTRLEQDNPNWGTLISLLESSYTDEEAGILSRALEKIS